MCELRTAAECKSAAFKNICHLDKNACTINDTFKDLSPAWGATLSLDGIDAEFLNRTFPADQDLPCEGDCKATATPPALGKSGPGSYSMHEAEPYMIQNAPWCHNAGGLWLAPKSDQDVSTAGWACLTPSTKEGTSANGEVAMRGGEFANAQTDFGLDAGLLATTGPLPTSTNDDSNIIDFYDCKHALGKKWQPVRNQPCNQCSWIDIWGGYAGNELTHPTKLLSDLFNKIGDMLGLGDVMGILTIIIWVCLGVCVLKFAFSKGK
jgi:hypothetical protein